MKVPDGEQPIQSPASIRTSSVPFENNTDLSRTEDEFGQRRERRQQSLLAGTVFGALIGLPLGTVVGAECCRLTGLFDFLWHGVLIGGVAGPFAGALLGFAERKIKGDLVRPDLATLIGIVYGLLPALLVLLQGMGFVRGRFSEYLLLGTVFVYPSIGLLLGGILDRAFEAVLSKSWSAAAAFGITGVVACSGLIYTIDAAAYGPEPKEVAREARAIILSDWEKRADLQNAAIQKVTLVRTGRKTYAGFVDATIDGQSERLTLEILVEERTLSLRLKPINE